MKNLIALKELRIKLKDYTHRVEVDGESFIVLRKSKPVFKIVPIDEDVGWEQVLDFTKLNPEGISAKKVLSALKQLDK